jgi:hypothetical protein
VQVLVGLKTFQYFLFPAGTKYTLVICLFVIFTPAYHEHNYLEYRAFRLHKMELHSTCTQQGLSKSWYAYSIYLGPSVIREAGLFMTTKVPQRKDGARIAGLPLHAVLTTVDTSHHSSTNGESDMHVAASIYQLLLLAALS